VKNTTSQQHSLLLVVKEVSTLPTTALRILFLGGAREEEKAQLGIGHLYQRMWTSGTTNFTSLEIAKLLESIGASCYSFCGKNTLGLSLEFLSKHWTTVEPVFKEVLHHPTFPEDEFETEKSLILQEIKSEKDSPGHLVHLNFMKAMYGTHPYGRSPIGTKESVESLTTEDLRKFHKDFVNQKHMVVSTVGSFQKDTWIGELSSILSQLPESGREPKERLTVSPQTELNIVTEKKQPLAQSHILLGFLATSFEDQERYALKVLSSVLAGQGGRLFLELRDKQSLAYSVSPMNSDGPEKGYFGFYIGCSPEKLETAITGLSGEIKKIMDKPIGDIELARAKQYWIGRFEMDMQKFGSQAMVHGLDEIYKLGFKHSLEYPEKIKEVSAGDIQSAVQKYFDFKRAVISIVHPEEIESSQVERAWL